MSSLKLLESRGSLTNNRRIREKEGGRGEAKARDTAARVVIEHGMPSLRYGCHVLSLSTFFRTYLDFTFICLNLIKWINQIVPFIVGPRLII